MKFRATATKKLNATYEGYKMSAWKIEPEKGKKFTRDDLKQYMKEYINKKIRGKKEDKNFVFFVSSIYPNRAYSGKMFDWDEEPDIFDFSESYDGEFLDDENTPINGFWVYMGRRKQQGGSDLHNDCLYNCLLSCICSSFPLKFKDAERFKKTLGLKRDDKVDIKYIPQIEEIFKNHRTTYAINVTGDAVYTSTVKSLLVINLKLKNGHYSIDHDSCDQHIDDNIKHNISFKERIPLMVDTRTMTCYDGENKRAITWKEYRDVEKFCTDYILVKYPDQKKKNKRPLEECYDEWIEIADTLKAESNGKINMYKCGSYQNTALLIFKNNSKSIKPEPLTKHESIWIKKAMYNGIMFSERYEGDLHKNDGVSFYPSLMVSAGMLVPVKQGEFSRIQNIDELGDKLPVAIFRAIITPSTKDYFKVFRLNKENYYTDLDMRRAKELNYKIEMIIDDQPNCLIWTRDKCLQGSQCFKKTIKTLYHMKEKGVKGAKLILNMLWGLICQNKLVKKQVVDNVMPLTENDELVYIIPKDDGTDEIKIIENYNYFMTNYARLGPFLLSMGRYKLSKVVEPIKDDVKRCYIDSIFSVNKIENIADYNIKAIENTSMGTWSYEFIKDAIVTDKAYEAVKGNYIDI